MKTKRIKYLFYIVIVFLITITLSGCKSLTRNEIVNNVTNNITETTTDYKNMTISTIEEAVQTCVKRVEDSVVGVTLKAVTSYLTITGKVNYEDIESVGSGVIYKREEITEEDKLVNYRYYCYTNAHVVTSDNAGEHTTYVYLDKYNEEIACTILGKDEKVDLAVIRFDSYHLFEPVELQDVSTLEKGTFVVAVGNPDGYEYYGSATFGIISNLGRYIDFDTDGDGVNDFVGEYIQTDAAINPGNSGGGLFTLDGKLVGINSIKLTSDKIDNMGFAIPSNIVKIVCNDYLEEGKQIVRARLGITCIAIRDMSSKTMQELGIVSFPNIYDGEKPYGIYITGLSDKGSLVGTGIEKGDILLEIDGDKLYSNNEITGRLNSYVGYSVGTNVTFKYYSKKNDKIITINVVLVEG